MPGHYNRTPYGRIIWTFALKVHRDNRNQVRFSFEVKEDFEFLPQTPEQFFVRAMNSGLPLFLTDHFLAEISQIGPDELVEKIIDDLHRDSGHTDATLRWFYLMMDFQDDFPRLMQLLASRGRTSPHS